MMGTRRILKTLGARWWLVLLIAILGGVVGIALARNYNDDIVPRWRAQAPITFIQLDATEGAPAGNSRSPQASSNKSDSASVDVTAERARAQRLLEDTLSKDDHLSVEKDRTDESVLYFVAVGSDSEETVAAALALRSEYETLGATVFSIDQIKATMELLLFDIDRIETEIDQLAVGEVKPEDGAVTVRRTTLQSEIDTLTLRQAQLQIWIDNPELRPTEAEFTSVVVSTPRAQGQVEETTDEEPVIVTVETLRIERGTNEVVLQRLTNDLANIPDPPETGELDAETTLEIEALTLDLADLQAQYVDLRRRSGGRPPGGFPIEPIVTDETASEVSVPLSALLGFLAGGILAAAALIAIDRGRNPVWAASDLEGTVSLGVIDRNRSDGAANTAWYPTSLSKRRRDIQALRAATDAVTEGAPAILGISGVDVPTDEVAEIAADLAAAYTAAGHKVLLIEGSGHCSNTLVEFGAHTDDINMILSGQVSPDDTTGAINEILDSTPEVIPCLTAIHVGGDEYDPIDAFASPSCRILVDVARMRYDIVILAGPDLADPLADAVARRVDFVVLVGWVGHTTVSRLDAAVDVLSDRRTDVAGTVLLTGERQTLLGKGQALLGKSQALLGKGQALLGKTRTDGIGYFGSATSSPTGEGTEAVASTEGVGDERENGPSTTIVSLERLEPGSQDDETQAGVTLAGVAGTGNVGQDSADAPAGDSDQ